MTPAPPLLVTADDAILEDAVRLAAAAGVSLAVVHDGDTALRSWRTAGLVLVGADVAGVLADRRPPRRLHVHLLARAATDADYRSAIALGAEDVIDLPTAGAWLTELLTDLADGGPGARGTTVGIVAGSGGAGATTFACALALTAAREGPTLLMDLDPLGPGADRVVGIDETSGVHWDVLGTPSGRLGSRSLRAALPSRDGLAVLTWPAASETALEAGSVREVLSAARRGSDLVVVDLPRCGGAVVEETVTRCDHVLVVASPTVTGVAAAMRLVGRLDRLNARTGLVVRTGRAGSVRPDQVAATLGVPLLAELPSRRRVTEHVELGLGPVRSGHGSMARAARTVLAKLATAARQ